MYGRVIQLPAVVRQIGKVTGNNRVYIEDYAYGYLHELKNRGNGLPIRAALYGHTFSKENNRFYFVYAASCVIDELESGMSQEQIAEAYFGEYQLIGYVNLYHKEELSGEKEGCYVFYEANEAMQNYLLANHAKHRGAISAQEKSLSQQHNIKSRMLQQDRDYFLLLKELIQKLILGIMILVMAVAVTAINHYDRICEFAIMAARAAQEIR